MINAQEMNILTLTPNPVIDISTSVPQLVPESKMRCTAPQYNPGGGGINVSRVIHRLGGKTLAVFPAGGTTGQFLDQLLSLEGVQTSIIPVQAATREGFAVSENSTHFQYRFGLPGNPLQEREWQHMLEILETVLIKPDFLVASGSLPPGVPDDFYARVAKIAKRTNTRMILDTSGLPLKMALAEGVFAVKPNLRELAYISGKNSISGSEQEDLAMALIKSRQVEIAVVSMGPRGAMLASDQGIQYLMSPTVHPKSTIGAGDSMVAGITFALANHKPLGEVLQYGVACGTATTMKEGTALCDPVDVKQILKWLKSGK